MEDYSLDYKLLHHMLPVDEKTDLSIKHSISELSVCMAFFGQYQKPKIVADNNAFSFNTITPEKLANGEQNQGMVAVVGYVPGDNTLYMKYPGAGGHFIKISLKKPLEQMDDDGLREIADKPNISMNSQLLVTLRDYVLEQPE